MVSRASRMLPTASLRPMRHCGRMGGALPVRPMRAPLPHPRAAADVRTRLGGTALGGAAPAAPAAYRLQTRRGFRYPPTPTPPATRRPDCPCHGGAPGSPVSGARGCFRPYMRVDAT